MQGGRVHAAGYLRLANGDIPGYWFVCKCSYRYTVRSSTKTRFPIDVCLGEGCLSGPAYTYSMDARGEFGPGKSRATLVQYQVTFEQFVLTVMPNHPDAQKVRDLTKGASMGTDTSKIAYGMCARPCVNARRYVAIWVHHGRVVCFSCEDTEPIRMDSTSRDNMLKCSRYALGECVTSLPIVSALKTECPFVVTGHTDRQQEPWDHDVLFTFAMFLTGDPNESIKLNKYGTESVRAMDPSCESG
jgi:hypothetical protein